MHVKSTASFLSYFTLACLSFPVNCENNENLLLTLAPPRNLNVKVLEQTKIVLEWDAPLMSGRDLRIEGYAVAYNCTEEVALKGQPMLVAWKFVENQTKRTHTITGLRPSTEYEIYLSSYGTHNGVRALSATVSIRAYTGPCLQSLNYIFPVAVVCLIVVVGSVVYARLRQPRYHTTIQ